VYDYLSRGALGFQPMDEVFADPEQDYTLPVLITAQMLISFRLGDGHDLWGYLDTVWNAVERADQADISLLPALMLRTQRARAAKKQLPDLAQLGRVSHWCRRTGECGRRGID
jgi:hypothetical protein